MLTYRSKTVLLVDPLTLSDAILAPRYAQTQEVICNDYQKYVCRNVKMYAIAELDIGRGKAALKEQASKATTGFLPWKAAALRGHWLAESVSEHTCFRWLAVGMIWRELHRMFDSLETCE